MMPPDPCPGGNLVCPHEDDFALMREDRGRVTAILESHGATLKEIKEAVVGNGTPGLRSEVVTLKDFRKQVIWFASVVGGGLLLGVLALVFDLLKKRLL